MKSIRDKTYFKVDKLLKQRLKVLAAASGLSMNAIINDIIEDAVSEDVYVIKYPKMKGSNIKKEDMDKLKDYVVKNGTYDETYFDE